MSTHHGDSASSSRLITFGAAFFIFALAISAAFDAGLRGLHVVQASIYVATIMLCRHGNRWGYFLGISAATFWNYVLLFASPLPRRFLEHPTEPDLVLQGSAWIANAFVIMGCLRSYYRLPNHSYLDLVRFVVAFALATGTLAVGIVVFSPQRLVLFGQALHPHWP